MAVTFDVPVDPLTIQQLVDDGFTSLTLWYADEPDGTYADSGITPSPTTLALALSGETYTFAFSYSGGSASQWFKVRAKQGVTYSDTFLSAPFQGGSGVSLRYLRRRLGFMLNDMTVFTTTASADANTATCTSFDIRRWPDAYFNNSFLYRVGTGENGIIDSSTQAGAINFSPDAGSTVASGEVLEITKRWTHDEYVKAINWACVNSYPTLSRPIVNSGVMTVDDSHLYVVPQDILTINFVEIETARNPLSDDLAVRGQPWQKVPHENIYDGLQLKFELDVPEAEDKRLRITGTGYISQMASDDDSTECHPHNADLLLYKAAYRLWSLKGMDAASSDRDFYMQQAQMFDALFEKDKASFRSKRKPQFLWGADARAGGGYRRRYDPRRDGLAA